MAVPARGHKIIGFYGVSGTWGMCISFGIVTAPRDADLPDSVYDMQELQNNPDRDQHRSKKRRVVRYYILCPAVVILLIMTYL